MDPIGYSEADQKALEAALIDAGNKLANPPSSIDELLSLLTRVEYLLLHVYQICTCHKVIMSVQAAIGPATKALISDKIFRHCSLDIQVAVASCIDEIVRITISDYPYTDAQMKEIFGLFMVAFKQLSCGSGKNYERAVQILETVAEIQSCLVMLDLEVEMNNMVIEMFQLFLDTIRPQHSSNVFSHMKTIMILIVQESYDFDCTTKFNLYGTLLSSVRMDNKNTSPRSWELGNSVMENCASMLQQHVREVVKAKNLNVADYAAIVASLCQDAPIGNDTAANEEVANVQVANEVACVQIESEEFATVNEAKTVQFVATDASGDRFSKLDERSQAGQEAQIQAERRRREIKPNTLMRPEEGYQHAWLGGGSGSSQEESYSVKKLSIGRDQPKTKESTMNQDKALEGSDKQKKTSIVNHRASNSELKDKNINTAREHESEDVVEKVVGSSMSKPTKAKPYKVEKKGSRTGKKTTNGVVRCRTVGAESAKVSKCNENGIISKKHESGDVLDKVVESCMPKPAKGKQSKVEERGSNKQQKTTKSVVLSYKVCTEKEKVCNSAADSIAKDKNENNTSADVVEKVVERLANQGKVEEKGCSKQKRSSKSGVLLSSTVSSEKGKVSHSVADPKGRGKNEIISRKHESEDVINKAAKLKQFDIKEKGSNKWEKTNKNLVRPITIGLEKEEVSLNAADSVVRDENEISPQKNESADVVEKLMQVLESSMSKPTKKSKANEKGLNKRKKATKTLVQSDALDAHKEKVSHSDADPQRDDESGITSKKHDKYEAGNVADKVVESPLSSKAEYPGHLDSEREKEPMNFGLEVGRELVNLRIMVWWPLDQTYYTGTVVSYDPVTKKHKIKYDDDEEEFLNMSEEKWEQFNERQSPQAQSSGKSESDPSPAKEPDDRTQKKAKKRKLCSSKKEHADPSSKRSKSEGIKPGHSALEPIHVNDESGDDETNESNISWKARAMSRAGKLRSKTSRR